MSAEQYGYIKISRKAYASDPWWLEPRVFSKWEAWEDCIQMASWAARKYAIGQTVESLGRGEFVASLRYLAERWGWDKMSVSRWLQAALKAERLQRQHEGHSGTVYRVVNYERYQGGRMPAEQETETAGETGERQQRDKTKAGNTNKAHAEVVQRGREMWTEHMGGVLGFPRFRKAWKELLQLYDGPEILTRWQRYLAQHPGDQRRYVTPETFASRFGLYAEPDIKLMTDENGVEKLHRRTAAGEWVPAA